MHPGTRYARLTGEHTTLTFGKQIQDNDNNRLLALNVRDPFTAYLRRLDRSASARRIRDGLSANGTPANALLGLIDAINALRDDIAARLPATEPAS